MSAFDVAINRLLGNEGGLVDNPLDPGGLTNWGISQRSYPQLTPAAIRGMTRELAVSIYKKDFWNAIGGDNLPPVLAFQALDFAVNSGISTAIRKLQTAAGVADDGHWGPASAAAAQALPPAVLTFRFLAARLDFMRGLGTWPTFGNGWAGRIANDMRFAASDLLGAP